MTPPIAAGPVHRPTRVRLVRGFCSLAVRALFRLRVEGRQRFATGPAIYCFNHLNWTDPLVLLAALPAVPKYAMFGPKEEDMTKGARNRLISWAGFGIPYRPAKTDMLETTRRVTRILDDGWVIVIAGEGRIHRGERELMPLADGTAYFALRAGVPVIPLAINGTSWLGVGRRIRIRVGEPIVPRGPSDEGGRGVPHGADRRGAAGDGRPTSPIQPSRVGSGAGSPRCSTTGPREHAPRSARATPRRSSGRRREVGGDSG